MLIFVNNTIEIIIEQAIREYPNECCGVLLGNWHEDVKKVYKVIPMQNQANEQVRNRSFLISPLELFKAEKEAEKESLEVLGFYHSHPKNEAIASQADIACMLPEYSYPIISVKEKTEQEKNYEMRSFIKVKQQKNINKVVEEEIQCK